MFEQLELDHRRHDPRPDGGVPRRPGPAQGGPGRRGVPRRPRRDPGARRPCAPRKPRSSREQTTKTYVGPDRQRRLQPARWRSWCSAPRTRRSTAGRVRSVQTPGGCGALRLGAELIRAAAPGRVVHVSTPTWANHVPLLAGSGLQARALSVLRCRHRRGAVRRDDGALERLPPRAVVLLHASCHNPTGADLAAG